MPEDWDPAWSPDGEWLAFEHRGSDSTPGLYVARVDGSERRLVVPGGHSPDWSPDGSALVFGLGFQIYRVDLANDSISALTTEGFNVVPAWSPDGQTIAFHSDSNRGYPTDIWLMDADGGNPRRVPLGTPPTNGYGDAEWAPSGDRLAAAPVWRTTQTTFVHRLFITDTLGQDTSWVTAATEEVRYPAWSPTGEWIAYVRSPGSNSEIRLVRPDGSNDHFLAAHGFHPTWSPDGQRVAFSMLVDGEIAVWSVALTGSDLQRMSWPAGLKL